MPIKNPLVTFRVYDKDLLSGNDYLSSGSFSIAKYLDDVFETDTSNKLYLGTEDLCEDSDTVTGRYRIIDDKKMYDRFEIPMRNKLEKNDVNFHLFRMMEKKLALFKFPSKFLHKKMLKIDQPVKDVTPPTNIPICLNPQEDFSGH